MATFRKLPSGSWQVRVRRKGESLLTKTFKSKALADKWARSIESQIDQGTLVDRAEAENTSLGELIDRYLIEVTPTKKTVIQETRRLKALQKDLGHLVLASIQSKHIATYRDKRLKEGKAGGTVIKDINSLSHIFNVAIKDWGIPMTCNPALMIRKPKAGKGRDRRLNLGELEILLDALCESPEVKQLVLLAIETGMRRSELLSMDWFNVDMPNRFVVLPDTKNGDSRSVPLSTKAIQILEEMPKANSGIIFHTKPDSVTQAFHRACVRANLLNLRFHDLRHEATSRLFEKGLNTMEVSSITGHKTLSMLKRYTHLKASDLALKLG